jgi:hypothetical protein
MMAIADNDGDRLRLAARLRAQLQRQALGQVARADAGRLHALQPAQGAAQAVEHLVVAVVGTLDGIVGSLGRVAFLNVHVRGLLHGSAGGLRLRPDENPPTACSRLPRQARVCPQVRTLGGRLRGGVLCDRFGHRAAAQLRSDLLERIGQVAVLVERFDQHADSSGVERVEAEVGELRAQVILQAQGRRVAVGGVELVAVVVGAGLARRLSNAVEVLALGAVLPVVPVGRAEVGGVDRR